jgi:thiosulfate/3-mercaptopyruvate sulfurtransferase
MDPIISPEQLARLSPDTILLDVRSGPQARPTYEQAHLAGAHFADLERQLSGPKADAAQGGRHPLPDVASFAAQLGRWGITPSTHVVVYDDQNGANAAARAWWMLRALGHEKVQVLDGGLQAALASGMTTEAREPAPKAAPPYPAQAWQQAWVEIEQVERARNDPARLLLDVRAAARYEGKHEPIDPVAGHIPGAENLPLSENLEASGRFKSADALRAQYLELLRGRDVAQAIVHCGSGVTACHTLLALERAGLPGASLYVGSWSEWCRQPGRERAP